MTPHEAERSDRLTWREGTLFGIGRRFSPPPRVAADPLLWRELVWVDGEMREVPLEDDAEARKEQDR